MKSVLIKGLESENEIKLIFNLFLMFFVVFVLNIKSINLENNCFSLQTISLVFNLFIDIWVNMRSEVVFGKEKPEMK